MPTISPYTPTVNLPSPPPTANDDESWIKNSGGTYIKSDKGTGSYAAISQQAMSGGTLDVNVRGSNYDLTTNGITFYWGVR